MIRRMMKMMMNVMYVFKLLFTAPLSRAPTVNSPPLM
jgi:hypothetical protein